jgi:hypothetical protein
MIEVVILAVVLAVTVLILWLAKRHGIVMRAEADGLEALPKELHEAEMREKKEKGHHL